MLVTHLHRDHFDDTAKRLLDKHLPLFCQPPDTERLHADGFTDVRARATGTRSFHDILIARTEGQHGTGEIGEQMAPVSGFVLAAADEPTVYIAGDTILCDEVREAIDSFRPDVIVVNASAAQFNEGGPIVMDNDDVVELARIAPDLQIVAVHFECVSHSTETRADLRERLRREALTNVSVPEDGAALLEGAAAREDGRDGLEQDREVQPDRPALEIQEVEPHEVVEVELGAAGDLPQAGDARQHEVALLVPVLELLEVALRQRPRPDERHLPAQHVDELRELVERVAPQHAPDARLARVLADLEQRAARPR